MTSDRFGGPNGQMLREKALADQKIVGGNPDIARRLAEGAKIVELDRGQQLFARHQKRDSMMYFIISGSVELSIEERTIATLKARQSLGEFPLLDFSFAAHQVSAEALEATTVAVVPGDIFSAIAEQYPALWKSVARSLAVRLDERNKLTAQSAPDLEKITIKQIWQSLTFKQLIAIAGGLIAIGTSLFALGQKFPKL